ncbi:MAG: hypothetical protein WCO56_26585 [Verrucomicrobiota bacterium]
MKKPPTNNGTAPPSVWADNQTQLARALNVSRQTIHRWRKLPGFPPPRANGRWSISATQKWVAENAAVADVGADDPQQATLRDENVRLQNEKLAFQLSILRKEYLPKSSVCRVMARFISAAKTRTFSSTSRIIMLARMAPDPAQAEPIVREELAEIWREMAKSEWNKPENATAQPQGGTP